MKDKNVMTIKALSILVVIQIFVLIFVNLFSFKTVKDREISKKILKNANPNNIVSFELKDHIDGFKVFKENDSWFVQYENAKLPALKENVENYLKILSDIGEGIVIYKGSDNSTDMIYGLDQKSVLNVTVKLSNKKEYKIEIGNAGSGRASSYLRKNGENRVRLCESSISSLSNKDYKDWTDRKLLKDITVKDFKSATVKFDAPFLKEEYSLTVLPGKDKKSDSYKIEPQVSGKELDELVVKGMINGFITMKADNFKLSGTLSGKTPVGSMLLELRNGKKIDFRFYLADSDDIGNVIVDIDGNDYLYLYHEESFKNVIKLKDDLYKK